MMPTKQQLETQIDELQAEITQLRAQLATAQGEMNRRTNPLSVSGVGGDSYMVEVWKYSTSTDDAFGMIAEYELRGDGTQLTSGTVPRWERTVNESNAATDEMGTT